MSRARYCGIASSPSARPSSRPESNLQMDDADVAATHAAGSKRAIEDSQQRTTKGLVMP
jgi:hypothetical protein